MDQTIQVGPIPCLACAVIGYYVARPQPFNFDQPIYSAAIRANPQVAFTILEQSLDVVLIESGVLGVEDSKPDSIKANESFLSPSQMYPSLAQAIAWT